MEGMKLTPDFGSLSGMRVICTGTLIAVPFAASMLAEHGAEVIEIERPGQGDRFRVFPPVAERNGIRIGAAWVQEGRNRLYDHGAQSPPPGGQGDLPQPD